MTYIYKSFSINIERGNLIFSDNIIIIIYYYTIKEEKIEIYINENVIF